MNLLITVQHTTINPATCVQRHSSFVVAHYHTLIKCNMNNRHHRHCRLGFFLSLVCSLLHIVATYFFVIISLIVRLTIPTTSLSFINNPYEFHIKIKNEFINCVLRYIHVFIHVRSAFSILCQIFTRHKNFIKERDEKRKFA